MLDYIKDYKNTIPLQGEFAIMSDSEKKILYNIMSELAPNSCVVEIGAGLGGSSCIMAAANPSSTIMCVEAFHDNNSCWVNQVRPHMDNRIKNWCYHNNAIYEDNLFWISTIDSLFKIDPSGLLAFKAITKQFPNIILCKGESPNDFLNWNKTIDVYFEDSWHENPHLKNNIDLWTTHLKPNGYILGHDYSDSFPDVRKEFNSLMDIGWKKIALVASLIILQKP